MAGIASGVVPEELWTTAQAKHGARARGVGRPRGAYLLSGMILCAHCGKRFQGHQQVDRRAPAYLCGGYIAAGRQICSGLRVPVKYLDDAVVDGIQKRLEQVLDRDVLRQKMRALLGDQVPAENVIPALEAKVANVDRKIARLVEVLVDDTDDLPTVRRALVDLERERERLQRELQQARAATAGSRKARR